MKRYESTFTVKTVKRYQHTFQVQDNGSGRYAVRCKPVGVEAFNLWKTTPMGISNAFDTVDEALKAITAYCKEHDIPFVKPPHSDPSKAGNADSWRQAAEAIAGITTSDKDEWLVVLGLKALPANIADLKKAYRAASKKAHPDLGGSDEAQHKVAEAYRNLLTYMDGTS